MFSELMTGFEGADIMIFGIQIYALFAIPWFLGAFVIQFNTDTREGGFSTSDFGGAILSSMAPFIGSLPQLGPLGLFLVVFVSLGAVFIPDVVPAEAVPTTILY